MYQKTIEKEIFFLGIGLHSGVNTKIILKPADIDTGIVFIKDNKKITATYNNVINTHLGTTIGINNFFQKFLSNLYVKFGIVKEYGIVIRTIEHIMSAIWACDIDNLIIEIDNKEIPIMDGSAYDFIKEIKSVNIKEQEKKRKYLYIKKNIEIFEKNRYIKISPYDDFKIDLTVDFNYGNIGKQNCIFNGNKEDFIENYSKAKTFCNIKDVELMQKHNLAKGGNENNAMVFDDTHLLNKDGFRYENEVVRHKLLDCIGDMFTSGYYIKGYIQSYKSGHTLDNKLLKKIFSDKNNYEIL